MSEMLEYLARRVKNFACNEFYFPVILSVSEISRGNENTVKCGRAFERDKLKVGRGLAPAALMRIIFYFKPSNPPVFAKMRKHPPLA